MASTPAQRLFHPPPPLTEGRVNQLTSQAEAAAADQVETIYRQILSRAPEHDFTPTLDRVTKALAYLGSPQIDYRTIHIGGTNGKTSTARLTESLLRAHGLRTGLFTSPHLTTVRERIALDGQPISRAAFVETWAAVATAIDLVDAESTATGGPRLSFFEALTVMAFHAFADAPVDVAVIEVGLGGSWDSTNVINPVIEIITPISRDHQYWLGDSIGQIAQAKAGILKPNSRAIIGRQDEIASEVIKQVTNDQGTLTAWLDQDFALTGRTLAVGGQLLDLRGLGGTYGEIFLPLHGEHQADNAACALAAVEAFFAPDADNPADQTAIPPLPAQVVAEGFEQANSPGRMEVARSSPAVIVDAAHNVAGATALVAGLEEAFARPLIGLVAMLDDKDAEGFLGVLEPLVEQIVITQTASPRAIAAAVLAELAVEVFGDKDRVIQADRLDDALTRAIELAEADSGNVPGALATGVLATGSVTLAAQVRLLLGLDAELAGQP